MLKAWIIAKRDFRTYFTSPIAYIIMAGFLAIMGWMFFNNLSYYAQQAMQYKQYNLGKGTGVTEGVVRPLYQNMNVVLLFLTPFITMRLFSEERKLHTLELLLTAPVKLRDVVVGKYLSAMLLIGAMLILTSVYPIVLVLTSNPDAGPILTNYLGTLLLASCYVSIGILFSSMTENQIVAGSLTFATCLFFWLVSWAQQAAGPVWGDLFGYLSLITHYNNFSQGILESTDIIFYVSFTGVSLFLAHRVLDSYRWR